MRDARRRRAAVRRSRLDDRARDRALARLRLLRADRELRPAARGRARGRAARGGARRRARASRRRRRPVAARGVGADPARRRGARRTARSPRSARPATCRRRTCRRATPCCSRSRSRGPSRSARAICSSASTCSTPAAIPTAGPSSCARSRRSRRSRRAAGGFHVHAPLIELTKAEIIQLGIALGVDYAITHSCYDPVGGAACGRCDACALRRKGFAEAGVPDPTRYADA